MHISAKVDYAIRAVLELASRDPERVPGFLLAEVQGLPSKFLEGILTQLRRSGVITSYRGGDGGYRLSRPASEIAIADVIRAVEGPLAAVRGQRPEFTSYEGTSVNLQQVWIAVRVSLREVLELTTIADVLAGTLPEYVRELAEKPDAWISRSNVST